MFKKLVKTKLIRYQIEFVESENSLKINLGLSQDIIVIFSEDNKIYISDRLNSWNALTGIWKMSLKNAMIFVSCLNLAFWILSLIALSFLKLQLIYFEMVTMILVASIGYSVLWFNYYQIRYENFKATLINWLDEIILK